MTIEGRGDPLTTSVCLCTRDGERYLARQLASLLAQERPVDEIVIGDDASRDGTLDMLRAFAASAPMPVKVLQHADPVGQAANLAAVLSMATGDVLFICDQDDIWHPDKVSVLVDVLEQHPSSPAAFSDSRLVDEYGRDLGVSLWEELHFSQDERRAVADGAGMRLLARRNAVAGHTIALRSSALEHVLPVPPVVRLIDWWIALLLAADGGLFGVDTPLVDYRQHGANTVGLRSRQPTLSRLHSLSGAERAAGDADTLEAVIHRLSARRPGAVDEADEVWLRARIAHARFRSALPRPRPRRILPVAREAASGRYRRFANGWRSAAFDVLRNDR